MYRIIETDNHGGDYPDEKFVNLPYFPTKAAAQHIAEAINRIFCKDDYSTRYWRVVEHGYEPKPGFKP